MKIKIFLIFIIIKKILFVKNKSRNSFIMNTKKDQKKMIDCKNTNRLKELRLEKGMRQKDVAEKIGVSPQSYNFYENWVNKPDPETLIKLADLFEVSLDYLVGRADDFGNIVNQSNEESFFTTPKEQDFLIKLRSLSSSTREMILHVLDNAVQVEKRTSS